MTHWVIRTRSTSQRLRAPVSLPTSRNPDTWPRGALTSPTATWLEIVLDEAACRPGPRREHERRVGERSATALA